MIKVTVDVGNECIADLRVWNNQKAPSGLNRQEYEYQIHLRNRWSDALSDASGIVRHDRRNSVWVLIDRVLNASGMAIPERS